MILVYFYEVVKRCDLELVIQEFLTFCVDSPDINATEQAIRNAIKILGRMEAIISNKGILYARKVEDEEYDAVYLYDTMKKEVYSIEAAPWAETLGNIADEKSLSIYGDEKFVALVLWEMTWFGYDESSIQERVKSMLESDA